MSNIIHESSRGIDLVPIEDEFLKRRELFLTGTVTTESMGQMLKQLFYLDGDGKAEITIYINSPGGTVGDGLAVYDVISKLKSPVKTVCIGTCASMGAILFLAGTTSASFSFTTVSGFPPTSVQTIALPALIASNSAIE